MSSRYSSQISLSEIGISGQKLIAGAKVLVIGAGGLGIPVATYLACSGVGKIGVMDGDVVQDKNLNRQYLYSEKDRGSKKTAVLLKSLNQINPNIEYEGFDHFLEFSNGNIFADFDVICDCTDDAQTKLLINELCVKYSKPLVFAAALKWHGYLTVLNYHKKIRLTDIFSEHDLRVASNQKCLDNGVLGALCGVIGSMQAAEVIKIIVGQDVVLDGKILYINILANEFKTFALRTVPE